MIEVESERLRLRQWRETDFEIYTAYYSDEEQARFVGGVKTREEAWRKMASLVGHWHFKGFGMWAVEEKDSEDFVGCVGLWKSQGWPELELGYWILMEKQNKGYAYEAALRSKDFAFDELKAESLVSYINPENTPSIKLAEKLGAKYDKTIELLEYGPHKVYRHK